MNVRALYSADIYTKILNAPIDKKTEIYRYELMQPLEAKWKYHNIPIKAPKDGGYDVIMASEMLGILSPRRIDNSYKEKISMLNNKKLWDNCIRCSEEILKSFQEYGINLKVNEYLFTILLADEDSIYTILNGGCCGDGGIPGYILLSLVPNKQTIERLPMTLSHEWNHNIRFQYIKWSQNVTLADMMITEGLAENYVAYLYGEEKLGPWVKEVDDITLNKVIKPIIREHLNEKGFDNITAYLYGDEIAKQQGYFPVGLPYCAGYACGYYMVKYYLEKTKANIMDATITSTSEIIKEIDEFW